MSRRWVAAWCAAILSVAPLGRATETESWGFHRPHVRLSLLWNFGSPAYEGGDVDRFAEQCNHRSRVLEQYITDLVRDFGAVPATPIRLERNYLRGTTFESPNMAPDPDDLSAIRALVLGASATASQPSEPQSVSDLDAKYPDDYGPTWSLDGATLLGRSWRTGLEEVWRFDPETGEPIQATGVQHDTPLLMTRSGAAVFRVEQQDAWSQSRIVAAPVARGTPKESEWCTGIPEIMLAANSPNVLAIYAAGEVSEQPDTSLPVVLFGPPGWIPRHIGAIPVSSRSWSVSPGVSCAWNPSGSRAVMLRRSGGQPEDSDSPAVMEFWLIDAKRGRWKKMATRQGHAFVVVGWSSSAGGAVIADLKGGRLESLSPSGAFSPGPAWRSSGRFTLPCSRFGCDWPRGDYAVDGGVPKSKLVLHFDPGSIGELRAWGIMGPQAGVAEIPCSGWGGSTEFSGLWVLIESNGRDSLDLDEFCRSRSVANLEISPDGQRMAYDDHTQWTGRIAVRKIAGLRMTLNPLDLP